MLAIDRVSDPSVTRDAIQWASVRVRWHSGRVPFTPLRRPGSRRVLSWPFPRISRTGREARRAVRQPRAVERGTPCRVASPISPSDLTSSRRRGSLRCRIRVMTQSCGLRPSDNSRQSRSEASSTRPGSNQGIRRRWWRELAHKTAECPGAPPRFKPCCGAGASSRNARSSPTTSGRRRKASSRRGKATIMRLNSCRSQTTFAIRFTPDIIGAE